MKYFSIAIQLCISCYHHFIVIFNVLTQLFPERTRTHDRPQAGQGLNHSTIAEAAYVTCQQ